MDLYQLKTTLTNIELRLDSIDAASLVAEKANFTAGLMAPLIDEIVGEMKKKLN